MVIRGFQNVSFIAALVLYWLEFSHAHQQQLS